MKDPIKVLVVDDSKLMRRVLTGIFESEKMIQVIGEAENGEQALELIPQLQPDVITLDINMPVMDGLTTLKHVMIKHPIPTVMLSTLTQEGADVTFDTLRFGAVDFVHKPSNKNPETMESQSQNLIKKVILASEVKIEALKFLRAKIQDERAKQPEGLKCEIICAMGACEGGYGALLKIIPKLDSRLAAAVLVILYESPEHVEAFSGYLDHHSPFTVKRARDGVTLESGICYIASGMEYVTVFEFFGEYSLQVNASPFPTRKGSINMMMISLAERAEKNAVGIILSGSGGDGIEGLCEIARLGGATIVQDPKTCIQKEMPENAIANCKTDAILPDTRIAEEINRRILQRTSKT